MAAPDRLNAWLDQLPRTRFGWLAHEVPAFWSCGVAGYYLALIATLAGGLLTGRSLLVLGVLAAVCALSFFAWAHVRRACTGRERLVQREHVWVAQLASALALYALGEPMLPYLAVIAVGLAFFLAVGRVGCVLVGCCHGEPASVGIAYGPKHARDGFPRHLVGVRLFPVPALESLGLLAIGAAGLAALPLAAPGGVLAWSLGAHAILRFGLEGLRGDRCPHALGLSVGRWMALAELAAALVIAEGARGGARLRPTALAGAGALAALLAAGLLRRHLRSPARLLLRPAHVTAVRALVRATAEALPASPVLERTPEGVSVGVSAAPGAKGVLVSLRLPDGVRDLPLLCELSARVLPELRVEAALAAGAGDLLFLNVPEFREPPPAASTTLADSLYGSVVRQLQEQHSGPPEIAAALEAEPTRRAAEAQPAERRAPHEARKSEPPPAAPPSILPERLQYFGTIQRR